MSNQERAEKVAAVVREMYSCPAWAYRVQRHGYVVVAVPDEGVLLPALIDNVPIWSNWE